MIACLPCLLALGHLLVLSLSGNSHSERQGTEIAFQAVGVHPGKLFEINSVAFPLSSLV